MSYRRGGFLTVTERFKESPKPAPPDLKRDCRGDERTAKEDRWVRGTWPPRRRLSVAVRLHTDSPKGRGLI